MVEPMKTLELHYPMMQFLLITHIQCTLLITRSVLFVHHACRSEMKRAAVNSLWLECFICQIWICLISVCRMSVLISMYCVYLCIFVSIWVYLCSVRQSTYLCDYVSVLFVCVVCLFLCLPLSARGNLLVSLTLLCFSCVFLVYCWDVYMCVHIVIFIGN